MPRPEAGRARCGTPAYGVLPSRTPGSPERTKDQWSLDLFTHALTRHASTSRDGPESRCAACTVVRLGRADRYDGSDARHGRARPCRAALALCGRQRQPHRRGSRSGAGCRRRRAAPRRRRQRTRSGPGRRWWSWAVPSRTEMPEALSSAPGACGTVSRWAPTMRCGAAGLKPGLVAMRFQVRAGTDRDAPGDACRDSQRLTTRLVAGGAEALLQPGQRLRSTPYWSPHGALGPPVGARWPWRRRCRRSGSAEAWSGQLARQASVGAVVGAGGGAEVVTRWRGGGRRGACGACAGARGGGQQERGRRPAVWWRPACVHGAGSDQTWAFWHGGADGSDWPPDPALPWVLFLGHLTRGASVTHDRHSYAEPALVRTTHLELDLELDFSEKVLAGRPRTRSPGPVRVTGSCSTRVT